MEKCVIITWFQHLTTRNAVVFVRIKIGHDTLSLRLVNFLIVFEFFHGHRSSTSYFVDRFHTRQSDEN